MADFSILLGWCWVWAILRWSFLNVLIFFVVAFRHGDVNVSVFVVQLKCDLKTQSTNPINENFVLVFQGV